MTVFDYQSHLADTFSWDVLAERVVDEDNLDEHTRSRCLQAIVTLRRHLGDDWPLSEDATGHPLLEYFTNSAEFTRVHLAQLGHAFELLAELPGWPALLGKFRQGREASGALLELDLAYPPLVRGWEVELGPASQPGRFADLRVQTGQGRRRHSLSIEASVLDDFSKSAKSDMSFQQELVPFFDLMLAGLDVGGRLLIDPTVEEEQVLLAAAEPFFAACLEHRRPDEMVIPGVLELWAVPRGDEKAKQSMLARGHKDGFAGGVVDDPLQRLVRVVRSKLGQLPLNEPGLIVLQPPPLLFRSVPMEAIVPVVQQQLTDSPATVGVGLIRHVLNEGEPIPRVLKHESGMMVVSVPDRLIYLKQMVLISNPAHTTPGDKRFALQIL